MDKELIIYVGKLCPREVELLVCTWSSRHIKVHIKLLDEYTIHGRNPTWFFQVWAIIGYIVSDLAHPPRWQRNLGSFPCFPLLLILSFIYLFIILRAALHYGGEVHQSVESVSPRHGYLRQGMVCRRRWKDNKIFYSSWSSPEVQVYCPRLGCCPRNLTSWELPF